MNDLLDALTPGFDDLAPHVIDQLYPDVRDPKLRKALLADPRNQKELITDLLGRRAPQAAKVTQEQLAAMRTLVAGDIAELALEVGAACQANHLSDAVARGTVRLADTDIPRAVIKSAMHYRHLVPTDMSRVRLTRNSLQAEGLLCLHLWLSGLPTAYGDLIKLRLPQSKQVADADRIAVRQTVAAAVLNGAAET